MNTDVPISCELPQSASVKNSFELTDQNGTEGGTLGG
jgi:hypothetical protein